MNTRQRVEQIVPYIKARELNGFIQEKIILSIDLLNFFKIDNSRSELRSFLIAVILLQIKYPHQLEWVQGHGFDLPGFRAGRKPCWIFSVLAVDLSGIVKCVGLTLKVFYFVSGLIYDLVRHWPF
jgi:hypothetical protein